MFFSQLPEPEDIAIAHGLLGSHCSGTWISRLIMIDKAWSHYVICPLLEGRRQLAWMGVNPGVNIYDLDDEASRSWLPPSGFEAVGFYRELAQVYRCVFLRALLLRESAAYESCE